MSAEESAVLVGDEVFWLVANGRGDVWDFDTEHAVESWAHGRAAVDGELVVWRTWAGEDA